MNPDGSPSPQNIFHYLIIDDSEIIRSQLSRAIVNVCSEVGGNCQLYQVSRNGQLVEQNQLNVAAPGQSPQASTQVSTYYIYTAATYKLALRVLDLPTIEELTVLSDMSIPADIEVGLLGLLETLARRQLPVNLIFISSEYQNRARVEPLLQKGKAYFIEKGTPLWDTLPQALVRRATSFNYQQIVHSDYSTSRTSNTAPAFLEKLVQASAAQVSSRTTVNLTPAYSTEGATNPRPGTTTELNGAVNRPNPRAGMTTELNGVANRPAQRPNTTTELKATPTPEPIATPAKPNRVGSLVNSVRSMPGRAGSIGTARLREIPDLLKNMSLPGRRRRENDKEKRDTDF